MSFMFKPYPYDDPTAVNHITVDPQIRKAITDDSQESMKEILSGLIVCSFPGSGIEQTINPPASLGSMVTSAHLWSNLQQ